MSGRWRAVVAGAVALFAAGSAAADECGDGATLVSGAGWSLQSSCAEGRARFGDRLQLERSGWVLLRRGGDERTCVNLGEAVEVTLTAGPQLGASLIEAGLSCGALRPASTSAGQAPGEEPAADRRPEEAPASGERRSVFVLPFERRAFTEAGVAVVVDAMTARLAGHRRLDVMSQRDVASLLELEASRDAAGCTEGASCLAELAGALGARYVVTGSVDESDGLYFLNTTLLDTTSAQVVDRYSVDGRTVEELARRGQLLGDNVARAAAGEETVPIEPLDLGRRLGDVGTMLSAAAVGVVPGAIGLVAAGIPAAGAVALAVASGVVDPQYDPSEVLTAGTVFLAFVAAPVSLLVPAVVALVTSMGIDRLDDVEVSWSRAASAAATALLVAFVCNLATAIPMVTASAVFDFLLTDALGEDAAVNTGFVTGAAVSLVPLMALTGLGAGLAYYFGVALFGDTPLTDAEGGSDE